MIERMFRHVLELIVAMVLISSAMGMVAKLLRDALAAAGHVITQLLSQLVPLFMIGAVIVLVALGLLARAGRRMQGGPGQRGGRGRAAEPGHNFRARRPAERIPRPDSDPDAFDGDDPVLPLF